MHLVKTIPVMIRSLFSMQSLVTCLLVTLMAETIVFGQVRNEFFVERITDVNSPLTEAVTDIAQDEMGFLWLATRRGLYRYDGHRLKSYDHVSNDGALSIAIDDKGLIWIGTFMEGVIVYNPRTDTAASLSKLLKGVTFDAPVPDIQTSGSDTWIVSQSKVLLVNLDKRSSIEIISTNGGSNNGFQTVETDQSGDAWIGANHGLLFVRGPTNGKEIIDVSDAVRSARVNSIDRIGKDTLMLGTDLGVFISTRKTLLSQGPLLRPKKAGGKVFGIKQAASIHVKYGAFNACYATTNGLYFISGEKVSTASSSGTDVNSLSSDDVHVVFQTRDGTLFVGTEKGLNRIVAEKQGFRYLKFPSSGSLGSSSAKPTAFHEDNIGNLWIGIEDEGLYHLDSNFIVLKFYRQIDGTTVRSAASSGSWLFGKSITSISSDGSGKIWIGTNDGLTSFEPKTGKAASFLKGKQKHREIRYIQNRWVDVDSATTNSSIERNPIWYIKPFDNFLLLESESEGTILVDAKDPDIIRKRYFASMDTIKRRHDQLFEDQFGHVLVYDNDGVKIFDPNALDFQTIVPIEKVPIFLKDIIYDEAKQCLWILTIQSLEKYTLNDKRFDSSPLLESPSHHAMLMDGKERFWIATNKSLLVFDPITRQSVNLTEKDGLPLTNFFDGVIAKNGNFLFGDLASLIQFDPNRLAPKKSSQKLMVTGIRAGSRIKDRKLNDSSDQPTSIEYERSLTLEYFENSILIEFTDLDLTGSSGFTYAYKIEPIDEDWVATTQLSTDVYTRLSPGKYAFVVKQMDENGHDLGQSTEFAMKILPPPWKTWWAYSLYGGAFLLLAYFLWGRWRTRLELKTLASIKSAEAHQLREMDTIKSNFFANISHEFRTPLTLLLGPIEKRLAISTDAADKGELHMMHRNASRLLTLVNQLLDLSRAEAGTLKLQCRRADLKSVILPVMSQFSSMADSKAITFDVAAPQPVVAFFDSDKLETIITNLLSNAFKFTLPGGKITLTITQGDPAEPFRDGYAEIVIEDTGMGIEPDHLPKIFDRFYQVDMSSTRAYEGSGIGLSLTKELVELHHGSVSVMSRYGQGSVFTVRLPLGDNHVNPEEIETGEAEAHAFAMPGTSIDDVAETADETSTLALPNMLLVEDNADLRRYLRGTLKHKFNLLEAENGEQGILMALQEVPDIIISDLMMPKQNGLELCQQLKEDQRTSHIPIILLTAKADSETKLQGYREGADEYISKPFQMDELHVRIENLLGNRRRIQEKFARNLYLSPVELPVSSIDERFIKKSLEIVERFIGDSSFGVSLFAQEMGVSHTQLSRKLNALTSFGPNEFIRHMRLLRAADLMRKKAGNVADITYQVGFNNLSYFSKVFREKFGITPIEYLKNPPKSPSLSKSVN